MGSLFSSVEKENKEPSAQPPQVEKPGERQDKEIHNRACFGAGCYWGTEKFFKIDFARKMYPESLIKKDFVGKFEESDCKITDHYIYIKFFFNITAPRYHSNMLQYDNEVWTLSYLKHWLKQSRECYSIIEKIELIRVNCLY